MKTCECQAINQDDANYCASCGRAFTAIDDSGAEPPRSEGAEVVTAKPIPRQRALRLVAAFIAVALVVAVGLTVVLRNVHIEITPNNLVSVQLPLNVCKTSVGDASETPAQMPASIETKISSRYSGKLAFYSDDEGLIEVLAPAGWKCSAGIGADGSSSVYVSPPSGANSAGSTLEAISASQTSACVGCRETLACPLFASAAKAYLSAYIQVCPTTRPPFELVTTINGHVVEFTDPPGVNGDASPSGGAYPALGVMTYFGGQESAGSWTETCVLPPAENSMCKAVIGNFESRYKKL